MRGDVMVKGTRRRRGRGDTWARGEMWGRGEKRLTWGAVAPRLLGEVASDERSATLRGDRGGRGEACGRVVCVVIINSRRVQFSGDGSEAGIVGSIGSGWVW